MTSDRHTKIEGELRESREALKKRLSAIQRDRRRESAPLDHDLEDQAIQRENDDALDALDDRTRREIAAIDTALARIESGAYGRCVACGGPISTDRLEAYPTAERCVECARNESAA